MEMHAHTSESFESGPKCIGHAIWAPGSILIMCVEINLRKVVTVTGYVGKLSTTVSYCFPPRIPVFVLEMSLEKQFERNPDAVRDLEQGSGV